MGPCWHMCPRLCCLFPLHKASACQASHRLKFLLLLASVVPHRSSATAASTVWTTARPGPSTSARCLWSSTGVVLTLRLSPPLVSGGQGTARLRFALRCAAGCDGEPTCDKAGVRKVVSMFWASPLCAWSPCHCAPTPHPAAAALAPVSSTDAQGWGPACAGRCRQEHTRPQHSLN